MAEQATAQAPAIGLYGKHPAFGDFVTAGLPDGVNTLIEGWLGQVLPALRDDWGEETWQAAFDAAPPLCLWVGAAVAGHGGLCGVMIPSRDRVGRRFPLLALVQGGHVLPPVLDARPDLYAALLAHVTGYARADGTGAGHFADALALAAAEPLASVAQDTPGPAAFWATRPDGDLARLWSDVAFADHARAAEARVYLWCAGPGGSAIHAGDALPDAAVLGWLLRDAVAAAPAADETEEMLAETAPDGQVTA